MPLTDTRIRNATRRSKPYKLTDGGGLHVEIRPNGSKLWRYRYRIGGKENLYALGEYANDVPRVESEKEAQARREGGRFTLQEARTDRDRCRGLVKQGIHPAHNRQALKADQIAAGENTFKAVALEWIEKNKARWRPYYLNQVETSWRPTYIPTSAGCQSGRSAPHSSSKS